jgi:pilus assembly protein CpaB
MNWKAWVPLVLAIVLGLLAAKITRDVLAQRSAPQVVKTDLAQIVVAKHTITPGQEIRADDITVGEVPAKRIPEGAFKNTTDLIGRVAQIQFGKDQVLVESLLAPKGSGNGLAALVPDGMRAMTLQVDEFSGVAGMLVPGSHVDVIAAMQGANGEPVARTIVQNVKVQAVGQKLTIAPPPAANEKKENANEPAPEPTRSVTLLVTPEQAEGLELACTTGRPRLVLRGGRDDNTAASQGVTIGQLRGLRQIAIAPPTTQPESTTSTPIAIKNDPFAIPTTQPAEPDTRRISVIRGGQETVVTIELPSKTTSSADANE